MNAVLLITGIICLWTGLFIGFLLGFCCDKS